MHRFQNLCRESLNLNSKEVRVGLSSNVTDRIGIATHLAFGNTIIQQGTNATGNFVGSAGIATGSLQVINAGIGYTSLEPFTHTGIGLTNITGNW